MKIFLSLLKIDFINIFTNKKKSRKKSRISFPVIVSNIIFIAVLAYLGAIFSILFKKSLDMAGQTHLLPFLIITLISILSISSLVFTMATKLFESKDTEILLSMPIKKSTIILSKLFLYYLISFVMVLSLYTPTIFIYKSGIDVNYLYYIFSISAIFLLPLIYISISFVFALIVSIIKTKIKSKFIINLVYLIGFLILTSFSIGLQFLIHESDIMKIILPILSKIFIFIKWISDSIVNQDIMHFIKFSIFAILPFLAFVYIFSKFYLVFVTKLSSNVKKSNYKLKKLKSSNPIVGFIKKDLSKLFASPLYIMNTMFSSVIVLISSIFSVYYIRTNPKFLIETLTLPSSFLLNLGIMITAIISLSAITIAISSISISLEGDNFWILKESPLNFMDIMKAKALMHISVVFPIHILSFIFYNIALNIKFDIVYILISIISIFGFNLFAANLGLIFNLHFPKLDFNNETDVIKRSASAMFSSFFGLGFAAISVYLSIKFISDFNYYLYILPIMAVSLSLITYLYIKFIGEKLWNKI